MREKPCQRLFCFCLLWVKKLEQEEQPIFRGAVAGMGGLGLAAQLPRTQKVAFLWVWTTGSKPSEVLPDGC